MDLNFSDFLIQDPCFSYGISVIYSNHATSIVLLISLFVCWKVDAILSSYYESSAVVKTCIGYREYHVLVALAVMLFRM